MVGITIRMPESFHTRLRVALAANRTSAQEIAIQCLGEYVDRYESKDHRAASVHETSSPYSPSK